MSQVNVYQPEQGPSRDETVVTVATRNLTWAIAALIVIAALVIAIVYLAHSLHP